jgi:hypothetical protein
VLINRAARQRNRWLLAAALAWSVLVVATLLDPIAISADWPLWARIAGAAAPGRVVLNAAILGPVRALFAHGDARASDRLVCGEGAAARWTVPPATWDAALAANARHNQEGGPITLLDTAMTCPPSGLACVATRDAMQIGRELFHIPSFAALGVTAVSWLDRRPACIELRGIYQARLGALSRFAAPTGDGGPFTLRFPVASGAEETGRLAREAWQRRVRR